MQINGTHFRTIWPARNGDAVDIIDQTKLPHRFETLTLASVEDAARAIKTMQVRGAPLIGRRPHTACGSVCAPIRPTRGWTR